MNHFPMRPFAAGLSASVAFISAVLASPAPADGEGNWQAVATAGMERVEIDKTRIMRTAPSQVLAWTRLRLGREASDAGGSYTSVQAMNRYDCETRTFATLKRVYVEGERPLREERIGSPKEIAARAGSADAWLLEEACRSRQAVLDPKVAGEATMQPVTGQDGKFGVMYADMRTAGDGNDGLSAPKAQTFQVADNGKIDVKPEAKPEVRPGSAADTRIEIRPPSERPRFIDLPKRETQAAAEAKPEPKPEARTEARTDAKAVAPKPAVSRPMDARELAKSIEAVMSSQATSRQERERMLATSGPRRAAVMRRPPAEALPPAIAEHREIQWSYEGEAGPQNWGKLRAEYGLCATGRRQSPIDIRDGIRVDLEPIKFDYRPTQFIIADTGHTVQVTVGEGSTISIMGRAYRLTEFHFHRPAEERVNGKAFDMVIHFTHRDDQGRTAMIAVLLEKGPEHPLIQTLWNNMPLEVNQDVAPAEILDLNKLLPEDRTYYTYMGSLTTPPCTEDVLWMVFKQPMKVSVDQITIFSRLYRNNARPIQPSNNRLVKENR
jgi:carbonic anhydrase